MRYLKFVLTLLWSSTLCLSASSQSQSVYEGNFMISKISNGMNIAILPITNSPNTEVTLYIKTGSIQDSDSLSGRSNLIRLILQHKVESHLAKTYNRINKGNTVFACYGTSEQIVYRLVSSENNIKGCMELLRDSIMLSNITFKEIDSARKEIVTEIDSAENNIDEVFKAKLLKGTFKQDYLRVALLGVPKTLANISVDNVKLYRTKYYTPNNSIISTTGKLYSLSIRETFESVFGRLEKSEFDPENITKIIDFHPVIYNTQFVVNKPTDDPYYEIWWQFPGTTSNNQASVMAYLLTSILNDKKNYLQVKAAKLGCREFTANYNAKSFSGVLSIRLQPNKEKLNETYQMVIAGMQNLYNTMINESMVAAGKVLFKKDYTEQQKTKGYAESTIRQWPYSDEYYYLSLKDTLSNITERQLQKFCYEYLTQSAYTAGLMISENDRNALNMDSVFTDLNEGIKDYIFTYRPNITDLEGEDNLKKQDKLVQWLKINADLYVKVNGFADEGEYNKVYDDTIRQFIDSSETFRRTMPQLFKTKSLRPEMMRAMKIIKYLSDHGIPHERLAGTSIRYKSDDENEALKNMKVTVTQDKFRKLNASYLPINK